eukprot:5011-Heterococcus_DN1.PRE.1
MLLALRVGGFRPGFPLLWDPNEGAGVITGDPSFAVPNNAQVRPVNFFTPGVYRFDFTPNFVPTDALLSRLRWSAHVIVLRCTATYSFFFMVLHAAVTPTNSHLTVCSSAMALLMLKHAMVTGFQLHWQLELQALAVAFAAKLYVPLQVAITSTTPAFGLPPLTSAEYFCSRLRDGFYDVFYPPVQVLDAQLALRNASEL